MIIKAGKQEIEVNEKDVVATYGNGIYTFQTRFNFTRFVSGEKVKLAKAKAEKMIKDGSMILIQEQGNTKYYKFNV